jgi:hypothetical protein
MSVGELSRLLNGVQRGSLNVRGLDVIVQQDTQDGKVKIRRRVLLNSHRALVYSEQWPFPRYSRSVRGVWSAEEVLLRAGLAPSDLHMPNWNHLNPWLGLISLT